MKRTACVGSWPGVRADGGGVVSHAGMVLLRELAARSGLTAGFSVALGGGSAGRCGHDPGRVAADVAVVIADGGQVISDVRTLTDQRQLHGRVASMATVWRVLDRIDEQALAGLRAARAAARERVWAARADTGHGVPLSRVAGYRIEHVVVDVDATLITAHTEKEGTAANYKGGYGFHPLLAYLDNTGEALASILRPGNATAHNATDHVRVLELALDQLPTAWREQHPVLIRADTAAASHAFVAEMSQRGLEYSIGFPMSEPVKTAISDLPEHAWQPAITTTGMLTTGGPQPGHTGLAEITDMLAPSRAWPAGMRVIVRREHAHPGAQLSAFEHHDGWRYQAFITNTHGGLAFLDARHRAHARVEDRFRTGKTCGLGKLPSERAHINAAWLELALAATDLLTWTQTTLLTEEPDLAHAEPRLLRYRLLHTAARLTRSGRRLWLRFAENWPWARALVRAFHQLRRIPLRT